MALSGLDNLGSRLRCLGGRRRHRCCLHFGLGFNFLRFFLRRLDRSHGLDRYRCRRGGRGHGLDRTLFLRRLLLIERSLNLSLGFGLKFGASRLSGLCVFHENTTAPYFHLDGVRSSLTVILTNGGRFATHNRNLARLGVLRPLRMEFFQKLGLIGVTHGRRFALNGNTGRTQLLDKDLSRDMQFPGEIGHSAICHKLSFSFVGLWLPVCLIGLLAVSPRSTGRHNQGVCTFLRNSRHFDEFVTGQIP